MWAVPNGIRRKPLNELLHIINNFDNNEQHQLPKDFRTLFSSQLKVEITELPDKQRYTYFGIEKMLNHNGLFETIFLLLTLSSN